MKRTILIVLLTLAGILGHAQSTNPLNYSGRMYVEATPARLYRLR